MTITMKKNNSDKPKENHGRNQLTLCNLLETSVYGIYFVMMQFSTAGILLSSSLLPTAVLGLGRPTRVSDQRK